uniref:Uncharacterized protein n=1 Tax=Vespula pensylvanica TaxID=30213 RepID=A0A834U7B6_VESPE|nr:hypothetical protein H0235_010108 [Vespula pensylvanica]
MWNYYDPTDTIELAYADGVILLQLRERTTHRLQPLDGGDFWSHTSIFCSSIGSMDGLFHDGQCVTLETWKIFRNYRHLYSELDYGINGLFVAALPGNSLESSKRRNQHSETSKN